MTRKEELQVAKNAFVNKALGDLWSPAHSRLCELSFEAGAEWADKTMIDKACDWLKNYFIEEEIPRYDNFIINFRKAMEK